MNKKEDRFDYLEVGDSRPQIESEEERVKIVLPPQVKKPEEEISVFRRIFENYRPRILPLRLPFISLIFIILAIIFIFIMFGRYISLIDSVIKGEF